MPSFTGTLEVIQGQTYAKGWLVSYNGDPIDDTWTAVGQIRAAASDDAVLYDLAPTVNPDGSVVIGITAAASTAWDWRTAEYGIEVTNADESVTLRVAQGQVTVDREVAR